MTNVCRASAAYHGRFGLVAVIFVVYWVMATHGKHSDSGDEPHYLVVTQSLVADGDFDLRNNYQEHQGRRFGADDLEAGTHVRETVTGQLFPVHDVGLSVALVPIYLIATEIATLPSASWLQRFRMTPGELAYGIISLFMIGVTTTAASVTRSALVADGIPVLGASAIVLAAWLAPPVLSNSSVVFPEVVALLATALFVQIQVAPPGTISRLRIGACLGLLALLPWFHRKYLPYSAALFLVFLWQRRREFRALSNTKRILLFAFCASPSILLMAWTWIHWHNLGGPLAIGGVPLSWKAFRSGSLGLLIDRENGLFVWAPVYLLLPAAWALARRSRRLLLPALTLFVLSAAHDQWWAGFSPVGRFLLPLVPIFALVIAQASRLRSIRTPILVALGPQILISAYGWQHTRALWPRGDGNNRVVGPVLGWFHVSQTVWPALRVSAVVPTRALVLAAMVVLINCLIAGLATQEAQRHIT